MTTAQLDQLAETYARAIADAVRQEYPNSPRNSLNSAADLKTPSELHPAFYGCFDWHSAVEMHWALVRLLRTVPQSVPAEVVSVIDEHLTADKLAVETAYFDGNTNWERPYGWGWLLMLAHELDLLAAEGMHPDAQNWADAVRPLASRLAQLMTGWLAKASYPTRDGAHANSAFALARSLPWARANSPELSAAIESAARQWFSTDTDYPVRYEPGGADFLSGALTEAVLMSQVLPAEEFARWFAAFLPDPSPLYTPAVVSDSADGYITHLNGLNLYRAHAFALLADHLGEPAARARDAHLAAALPAVIGGDWMAEHWLAAFAILALS